MAVTAKHDAWLKSVGLKDVSDMAVNGGRRPLGEAWLRVGAINAEFNMDCYGVAR